MASPVTVSLRDLEQGAVPLQSLEAAFGPESLGILIVKDLPSNFPALRQRVLSYSSYLANLSPEQLATLESPEAKYLVGWSRGKETLRSGHYDTLKGSYYINCAFYQDPALQGPPYAAQYPDFAEYTAPNVWPAEATLAGFEQACKELCSLIIDTAALVATACDRFGVAHIDGYRDDTVAHIVRTSLVTKARLLHYFPANPGDAPAAAATAATDDDWCATHVDHGCLTGLTSAMYVDETTHTPIHSPGVAPPALPELPAAPDPRAGLYIHARSGAVTKVAIPRDALAFQTGEALERLTQGKFRAVPHFVRGAAVGADGRCVARNTLAVFTQPNLGEVVDRESGLDFAGFAREVVARNT